jgi:hypothetical protein
MDYLQGLLRSEPSIAEPATASRVDGRETVHNAPALCAGPYGPGGTYASSYQELP